MTTFAHQRFVQRMLANARASGVKLREPGRRVLQLTAITYHLAATGTRPSTLKVALGPVAAADEEDVRAAIGVLRGRFIINIERSFLRKDGEEGPVSGEDEHWTLHLVGDK